MASFFAERADNSQLWTWKAGATSTSPAASRYVNAGHRHPKVIGRHQRAASALHPHLLPGGAHESYIALAEKLNMLTPGRHAKKIAFFSTGAEAVENAIKIARPTRSVRA
jgi:4-aminobutyrate aminotransferase-like enzyme